LTSHIPLFTIPSIAGAEQTPRTAEIMGEEISELRGRGAVGERLQRMGRRLAVVGVHAAAFAAACVTAAQLRFDFQPPADWTDEVGTTLLWIVVLKLAVFGIAGQYSRVWRHVSFADMGPLARTTLLASAAVALVNQLRWMPFVSRGVLLLDCGTTFLFVGALRCLWRFGREQMSRSSRRPLRRALLVGADRVEKILALNLHLHPQLPYRICGFLDADSSGRSEVVGGVPVLGRLDDLSTAAAGSRISDVIAIAGGLPARQLRKLREQCDEAGLQLRILPPLAGLLNGERHLPLREVDLRTLLHREPIKLDRQAMRRLVEGRVVMVSGAGGSIGSEICRQVLELEPRALLLVEQSEGALYQIDMELSERRTGVEVVPCLADIIDTARMRRLLRQHQPDVIFHAAAHKHVPLLELQPGEAVKNNLFGTARLAELASECGVERFVFISTDKAVHPRGVMGTTKYLAERYVHALSGESATRFVCVRFGNVLGSAGSVVPLFQKQIRRGGPITVTHPDMNRYFMTIEEASQLVLQSAAMGRGGEVFVLDMGEPVRIVDLARDLVRVSGLPPEAVDIVYSGIRPGEKLSEQLYFDDERNVPTEHPKVWAARHRPVSLETVRRLLRELESLVDGDDEILREKLTAEVPQFICASTDSESPGGAAAAFSPDNVITSIDGSPTL
jgi:FlaA1/EpsC-like NDP-sugar epimerase